MFRPYILRKRPPSCDWLSKNGRRCTTTQAGSRPRRPHHRYERVFSPGTAGAHGTDPLNSAGRRSLQDPLPGLPHWALQRSGFRGSRLPRRTHGAGSRNRRNARYFRSSSSSSAVRSSIAKAANLRRRSPAGALWRGGRKAGWEVTDVTRVSGAEPCRSGGRRHSVDSVRH